MSLKTTTLMSTLALIGALGCDSTTQDFTENLGIEDLTLVAAKGLDSLERELNEEGDSLADVRFDSDTRQRPDDARPDDPRPEGLKHVRERAIELLRQMAEREECALQGVVTGRYRGDTFKLAGHWWNADLAGQARGRSEEGEFRGRYRDMSGGNGTLSGEHVRPGVDDERFGVFSGSWTPADADESAGNLVGIWHPLFGPNNGVIFGVWSSCLEYPVHREPVDVDSVDQ